MILLHPGPVNFGIELEHEAAILEIVKLEIKFLMGLG